MFIIGYALDPTSLTQEQDLLWGPRIGPEEQILRCWYARHISYAGEPVSYFVGMGIANPCQVLWRQPGA